MTASFGTPPRARIAVLAVLLAALLGVVGARLYVIQIIRHERLGTRAEGQYERRIPVAAKRGTIYDRRGRMLVITLDAASVFA
ncbi:MAG: stage V sporulation protein D, partial [Candidatus Methylomirabilales bacterium]